MVFDYLKDDKNALICLITAIFVVLLITFFEVIRYGILKEGFNGIYSLIVMLCLLGFLLYFLGQYKKLKKQEDSLDRDIIKAEKKKK